MTTTCSRSSPFSCRALLQVPLNAVLSLPMRAVRALASVQVMPAASLGGAINGVGRVLQDNKMSWHPPCGDAGEAGSR